MSIWKTALLGIVVLGLGAYIYLVERPDIGPESDFDRVYKVETDEVSAIRIEYPDSPTLSVERSGDGWSMTEPVDAPGDKTAIDRLLDQILGAKAERRIPGDTAQEPAVYGLADKGERARVTLTLKDGSDLPGMIVGKTTPVGYQAFVRLEGIDEVIVVPLIVHTGVKKTPFELRDKSLFNIDTQHVSAVTLQRGTRRIRLERDGEQWYITEPHRWRADENRIQSIVLGINALRAQAFYGEGEVPQDKLGFDKEGLTLSAELADKGNVEFRLGAKTDEVTPGYYFERASDGQLAKVGEWTKTRFDLQLDELRDKHLFDCKADEIAGLRFERADGRSFALTRAADGQWTIEPSSQRSVRQPAVKRARESLANLSGKDIVSDDADSPEKLAPYGLDAPVVEVEALLEDGSACGRALASVVNSGGEEARYYVKRADQATVMSVPQYLYSRLDMLADDFLTAPAAPQKTDD